MGRGWLLRRAKPMTFSPGRRLSGYRVTLSLVADDFLTQYAVNGRPSAIVVAPELDLIKPGRKTGPSSQPPRAAEAVVIGPRIAPQITTDLQSSEGCGELVPFRTPGRCQRRVYSHRAQREPQIRGAKPRS